jgi:hypothetical protein
MIKLADYPQLRMLAWNRPADACLDEDEAFSLYEANWRFMDQDSMQPAEMVLLQRLIQAYGAGLLLV